MKQFIPKVKKEEQIKKGDEKEPLFIKNNKEEKCQQNQKNNVNSLV